MDKLEVAWRAARAAEGLLPRRLTAAGVASIGTFSWEEALDRFRCCLDRPVLLDADRASRIFHTRPDLVIELIESADRVADSNFQFFGYPAVELGKPIDWNFDPFAGVAWPDCSSRRIDYRSGDGDVKWIWELNRLQHLPWLAEAWLFTGDARFSEAAFAQIDSWIAQNPPGRGIAWRGAFEAGIRAVSIAIAIQGLRNSPGLTVERFRQIVRLLAESASYCWQGRSLHSSANNHLIGEMTGLAVISILFPELRRARTWQRKAVRILSAEASKQILADGAGAEQAIGYQLFTVELLHLVAVLMEANGQTVPDSMRSAVIRSTDYVSSIAGQGDWPPRYGDDDGGFAVRLGTDGVRTPVNHLEIVRAFCFGDPNDEDSRRNLDAMWFSGVARGASAERPEPTPGSRVGSFFADASGLVVLRDGNRRITMDVGPLGYLSIAAHGHADALGVTLSDEDGDVISDPGTGSYYGHPDWRAVMRGTRAHPTVSVDGQDQSIAGGPFLWTGHPGVEVLGMDLGAGVVDACHDGYARLNGRVVHRRWLVAPPGESSVLVVDLLTGSGLHEVRINWPLHPELEVERNHFSHLVTRHGQQVFAVTYAATDHLTLDEVRGDTVNNLGWWSELLESRVPAWWISAVCEAPTPVVVASLMSRPSVGDVSNLTVELGVDGIDVRWMQNKKPRSVALSISKAATVKSQGFFRVCPESG